MIISELLSEIALLITILSPLIYIVKKVRELDTKVSILGTAELANYMANPHLDVGALKNELGGHGVTVDDFFIDDTEEDT